MFVGMVVGTWLGPYEEGTVVASVGANEGTSDGDSVGTALGPFVGNTLGADECVTVGG